MSETTELKGYLGGFDLTDVLQLISQQQKTGILSIESDHGSCSWHFKDGMLVGLNVNLNDNKFDLQELLLKAGRLQPREAVQLRQEQLRLRTSLEQLLLSKGILDREEMIRLNQTRLFELLAYVLAWKKGSYTFMVSGNLHYTPFLPPQQSDFLLLEILRQMDEMHHFEKAIASEYTIFEPVSTFAADVEDDFFHQEISSQLPAAEKEIFALVCAGLSVQDIIDKSLQGRYNVYRTLNYFLEKGIIAPRGEKAARQGNLAAAGWLPKAAAAGSYLLLLVFAVLVGLAFMPSSWLPASLRRPATVRHNFSATLLAYQEEENKFRDEARALLAVRPQPPGTESRTGNDR